MAGDELRLSGLERLQRIGAGGFGTVYRAWQPEFGRWVAVKVMADVLGGDDDRRRFERERLATGSLSAHPSIVTVYDHGTTPEGRPYIIMELLEGGSLADRIAEEGPLAPESVFEVGVGLAGALAAAHDAQVLHRDVKPENVLFSGYGAAALADFGIARLPGATATRSGVITASLSHAPPEVLNGEDPTTATDVYGLASTLWTAAVGRAPFQRGSDEPLAALVARIATAPPPDAAMHGVPTELAAVLTRGLAKDPAERPASAAAFGRQLQEAQEQLGLTTTPLVLGGATTTTGGAGRAALGPDGEDTRPRAVELAEESAGSNRRRTLAALVATLLIAGTAGAWALTRAGGDAPVVAAPSEVGVGGSATPSPLPSRSPSAKPTPEASPTATEDDLLAGEDDGSGSDGPDAPPRGTSPDTSDDPASEGPDPSSGTGATPPSTTTTTPTPTATSTPTSAPSPTSTQQPNKAPTAAYVTRVPVAGSEAITFDGSSSSDPDGDALTYTWTFNDGSASKTGVTISKTFTIDDDNTSSRWTVKLTVTDARGAKDSVDVPTSVVMPALYEMNSLPAFRAVRGAGLNPFYSPAWNVDVAFSEYDVWSQWPKAGTSLAGDSSVRIVVWDHDTCGDGPDSYDHWWCNEDPPPSPTLDRSYL